MDQEHSPVYRYDRLLAWDGGEHWRSFCCLFFIRHRFGRIWRGEYLRRAQSVSEGGPSTSSGSSGLSAVREHCSICVHRVLPSLPARGVAGRCTSSPPLLVHGTLCLVQFLTEGRGLLTTWSNPPETPGKRGHRACTGSGGPHRLLHIRRCWNMMKNKSRVGSETHPILIHTGRLSCRSPFPDLYSAKDRPFGHPEEECR